MRIMMGCENFNGEHVHGLFQILKGPQCCENEETLPIFCLGNGSELDLAGCVDMQRSFDSEIL